MRITNYILIAQIKMDRFAIQSRTLDLVKHIDKGGYIPPIKVACANGYYIIRDGRHRVTALKLLGHTKVLAKYSPRKLQQRMEAFQ